MQRDTSDEPATPRRASAPRPRRKPSSLTAIGALLLCLGVAGLGWVGWQYYGTNVTSNHAFEAERQKLRDGWSQPTATALASPGTQARPLPGDAMALLRIPELGSGFEYPVVAGVGEDELARGVGWYPHSALPGEIGNFAVAGHRITHGEPFARLLELKVGAHVVVETRTHVYTYVLTTAPADLTVSDADVWVVDPVPGKPAGTQPTERLMTLTTCTDLFASPKRSVAFARLAEQATK